MCELKGKGVKGGKEMLCVNQLLLKVDFSLQVKALFKKLSVNNLKSDTAEVGKVKQL